MNKIGRTAMTNLAAKLSVGLLITASVACSHQAHRDNAAPAPTPTPVAAADSSAAATYAKATASKTATASSTSITCVHGTDSRELAVESKGSGCNTNYTKNGKTSSVATGTNGVDHCQKTVDKIRTKLEASGFICK